MKTVSFESLISRKKCFSIKPRFSFFLVKKIKSFFSHSDILTVILGFQSCDLHGAIAMSYKIP